MTETVPPGTTAGSTSRRLVRREDDRVVGGVAAALGTYTDVDPVLYRVMFAVLLVFGGIGICLYIVGWLLIPRADEPDSAGERMMRRARAYQGWRRWIVLAVAAIALLALLDGDTSGLPALIIIGAVAYLVHRERGGHGPAWWQAGPRPSAPPVTAPPVPPAPAATVGLDAPVTDTVDTLDSATSEASPTYAAFAPPVPRRRRRRSRLGLSTISVAALTAGWLIALRLGGASGITTVRILAAETAIIGGGLLVGAWYGRARWLILPAGLLTLALVPAAVVQVPLQGGTGHRTWRPTAAGAPYRLGIGDATLDLADLSPASEGVIEASVGIGSLVVDVPDDVHLRIHAQSDIGQVVVFGDVVEGGPRASQNVEIGSTGPVIQLIVEVGIGEVEVRHA